MDRLAICAYCGESYIATRKDRIYCSVRCKQKKNSKNADYYRNFRYASLENTLICILWNARSRAKRRGIFCDLTEKQVLYLLNKQNRLCAMTGLPLELTIGNKNPFTISIDRIIPEKGYTINNIQLVCTIFNECKNCYSIEDVKKMCIAFIKHNKININDE